MATMPVKSPRRLPTLSIAPSPVKMGRDFILSPETPEEYHTPLSAGSPGSAPFSSLVDNDDKMAQDLMILERLRRNVQMNLQLRPIAGDLQDDQPSPSDSPSVYGLSSSVHHLPISPRSLSFRLSSLERPLLIDTRNGGSYLASRIVGSVNIAVPSLILKRHRKPGAGFSSVHSLRSFVTTERGKGIWDHLMRPGGHWDGDVVVYDEEMDGRERESTIAWILVDILEPLLRALGRSVMYLNGGITAFRQLPDSQLSVVSGERDLEEMSFLSPDTKESLIVDGGSTKRGLFNLDTTHAKLNGSLPDIEHPTASSESLQISSTSSVRSGNPLSLSPPKKLPYLSDPSPSPPPSAQLVHRRSQPDLHQQPRARPHKPSVPNLRRLDTTSAERLPKLSVRTQNHAPTKAVTLSVPPSGSSSSLRMNPPRSPSHLNFRQMPSTPLSDSPATDDQAFYTPATAFFTASPGPSTPRPHSPQTARPPLSTPCSEVPNFSISCILPNFLFLGPELTSEDNVRELQGLGVKRILNLAAECDPDDHGLRLRDYFERYTKIAMRDTVEEENIGRGVREVCDFLDDARLHSSATYVHCKAGKSRSVTAVMAYLIHANHWTLSRAYSFVLERRKGISPNIGFVSELMSFEEQELGGKSVGVVKNSDEEDGSGEGRSGNYGHVAGMRRAAHMRESLPPVFSALNSDLGLGLAGGGSGDAVARMGDHAQELEVKDSSGRYRHQRRAPVDETTLQPLRRVSKAGLESGWT